MDDMPLLFNSFVARLTQEDVTRMMVSCLCGHDLFHDNGMCAYRDQLITLIQSFEDAIESDASNSQAWSDACGEADEHLDERGLYELSEKREIARRALLDFLANNNHAVSK